MTYHLTTSVGHAAVNPLCAISVRFVGRAIYPARYWPVLPRMLSFTLHSSLVTRHSSLFTRHSSLVTHHFSLVTHYSLSSPPALLSATPCSIRHLRQRHHVTITDVFAYEHAPEHRVDPLGAYLP